ncbi:MAG: hypothetical protein IKH30_19495 [Clostridia bacterium]|nr:hypothetical protein [Clostridia bacterium]
MRITIQTGLHADMSDFVEGLNDLMADLEDIRDDMQDRLDEKESEELRAEIGKVDQALKLLSEAADLLDGDD